MWRSKKYSSFSLDISIDYMDSTLCSSFLFFFKNSIVYILVLLLYIFIWVVNNLFVFFFVSANTISNREDLLELINSIPMCFQVENWMQLANTGGYFQNCPCFCYYFEKNDGKRRNLRKIGFRLIRFNCLYQFRMGL